MENQGCDEQRQQKGFYGGESERSDQSQKDHSDSDTDKMLPNEMEQSLRASGKWYNPFTWCLKRRLTAQQKKQEVGPLKQLVKQTPNKNLDKSSSWIVNSQLSGKNNSQSNKRKKKEEEGVNLENSNHFSQVKSKNLVILTPTKQPSNKQHCKKRTQSFLGGFFSTCLKVTIGSFALKEALDQMGFSRNDVCHQSFNTTNISPYNQSSNQSYMDCGYPQCDYYCQTFYKESGSYYNNHAVQRVLEEEKPPKDPQKEWFSGFSDKWQSIKSGAQDIFDDREEYWLKAKNFTGPYINQLDNLTDGKLYQGVGYVKKQLGYGDFDGENN